MIPITIAVNRSTYERLRRLANEQGLAPRVFARELITTSLDALDPTPEPVRRIAPHCRETQVGDEFEVKWRPHRDAPSLIGDLQDGRSPFPRSSVHGARIVDPRS